MANQCKYTKQVLQVSYDSGVTWVNIGETRKGDLYEYNSPACGAITEYRWVDVPGLYTCEGTTKYQKTKKQYSEDGGQTWSDVSPAEYGKGQVLEYDSADCGGGGDYENKYLTFVALEDGTFRFKGRYENNIISYSLDGGKSWSTLAYNTYSPTVAAGNKIMWKSNLIHNTGVGWFYSTGRFYVEGNIMSLLYGDNFEGQTSLAEKTGGFGGLFSSCTKLTSAENLILPATTLVDDCYYQMFSECASLTVAPKELPATTLAKQCYTFMFMGCTSLTSAPELPATTLAERCYWDMFAACENLKSAPELPATILAESCYWGMFQLTNLTTAPELPATTLANSCYGAMFYNCKGLTTPPELPATTLASTCYSGMFEGCTNLATAPELPATTLAEYCYGNMFYGCTSLNYIKCLATDISATDCTGDWLRNTSATGTFVKAASMNDWTTGNNGIPTNWTVQNA